ncbi:nitrate- and nitrite sensing domain-containing protein [Planomonospora sp. ID82291]|uniref:sensor histidine kinase n=1 Tax=Planomonospora sp. ID82291 TaxID=2738136 RepID=UPI0018C41FDD|nr:nitrate- and nitrite sensing domain-containing protein [Planomonospora sp. ID82291]MBG0814116.1 sensor histidine kinase [Planomonospora sp. ID82291]
MGSGNRSIRFKIFLLLLLPLLSLSALWGFVLNLTVGDGTALLRADRLYETVGVTSTELGRQLQAERARTSTAISSRELTSGFGEQRARTDRALAEFRTAERTVGPDASELRASLDGLTAHLAQLPEIRSAIDGGRYTRLEALSHYNEILDAVFLLYDQLVSVPDLSIFQQATAVQAMGNAREMLAREDALISGALIDGRFSADERAAFAEHVAARRFLHARGLSGLDSALGKPYQELFASPAFERFETTEAAVISGEGAAPPAEARPWKEIVSPLADRIDRLGAASSDALAERSRALSFGVVARIALAGGVGLAAVVVSIIISVRFGRRLAGELAGLRTVALDLADVRLPRLVARLRRGEEVDVAAEAPPIEARAAGGSAEVIDVAHAFGSVQRTAIEAAVGQADLRRGVSQVFVNLARRKQGLLHRQLSLLDGMQRRATDPEGLDDLFRLDHLTTRMRRHAESLIILSGAAPGRAWSTPVPVVDVVRAAIAEVEDYRRIIVSPLPDALFDGTAVADVTHLIAELLENATIYSPPQTTVTVRGDVVANGFAVEVEDRGLGLSDLEYEEINARLADPPEFDLADSDRLGLFVVGRLAARHGIQVVLRASPFGGTTAIVLVPRAVLAELPSPLSVTAERIPRRSTAPRLAGGTGNGTGTGAGVGTGTGGPAPAAPGPAPSRGGTTSSSRGAGLPRRTRTVPPASPARASGQPLAAPTLTVVNGLPDGGADDPGGPPAREITGPGSLPRRVRQANLAPQLRQDSPPPEDPAPDPPAAGRSPEEARALFSAFQAGARRGREEQEDGAGAREDGAGDLAHQKTGEKEDE